MKNILLILVLSTTFIACEKDQAKNLPAANDPCDIISGLCEITERYKNKVLHLISMVHM